jgi:branched-subunit amino acid permease
MMGLGGVGGPEGERRRRLVAGVLVLALFLGAGAVVFSIVLS